MTQEADQNAGWSQDMQDDHMVATAADDDFTKFLDLDSDFSQFTAMAQSHSGLDTPMGRLGFGNPDASLHYDGQGPMDLSMASVDQGAPYDHPMQSNHSFTQYQQQYQQMQMQPHYHVPPTPVSAEMHAAKYTQHMGSNGQILFDHQQVSFTPLVSPAQTPMDGGFAMSEYGLPDEFFSPLTSPAIEAQAAYSGTTASPIDLDADLGNIKGTPAGPKRPRRAGANTGRTSSRSVKQSPAMKPQIRRRHPSLTSLPPDKVASMLSNATQASGVHSLSTPPSAVYQPSDESVSPEALSESAMRPPPVPQPSRSPNPPAQSQADSSSSPVTPATLMKMPSKQTISVNHAKHHTSLSRVDEPMEDIMLPAAVSTLNGPVLSTLDTTLEPEGESESTPTLSAKTAKISTTGTPGTPRGLISRTTSQDQFAKPVKMEGRGVRASKKRQTTSSATISPALRPKISPSISPLVPATGPGLPHISPDASALYLASKSNYQNILEGTHLPGVSYPETLAENLTSKRTSHKIAEQGRRNRINLALKEIESLLPPSISGPHNKKDKSSVSEMEETETKTSAASQSASKASTVEMAIIYIKSLQTELAETKGKLADVEKRLAESHSSVGSQASEG